MTATVLSEWARHLWKRRVEGNRGPSPGTKLPLQRRSTILCALGTASGCWKASTLWPFLLWS